MILGLTEDHEETRNTALCRRTPVPPPQKDKCMSILRFQGGCRQKKARDGEKSAATPPGEKLESHSSPRKPLTATF